MKQYIGTNEKKSFYDHPYKKIKTHKEFEFKNLSIENVKEKKSGDSSYLGIEIRNKKLNKSTYKILDSNYQTEYPTNLKNTFKMGSHQNSLEGTFKFEKEKRYSQNGKWRSKELFQDPIMNEDTITKAQFNSSMNCAKKLNLDAILLDINMNNSTNSARQRGEDYDHSTSMGIQLKNRGSEYIK